jgi:hypothetical protein
MVGVFLVIVSANMTTTLRRFFGFHLYIPRIHFGVGISGNGTLTKHSPDAAFQSGLNLFGVNPVKVNVYRQSRCKLHALLLL